MPIEIITDVIYSLTEIIILMVNDHGQLWYKAVRNYTWIFFKKETCRTHKKNMILSFVFLYFPLSWGQVLSSIIEQEPLPSRQGKHYRADHHKSMSSLVCGADPLNHKHGGYKYLKEGSNTYSTTSMSQSSYNPILKFAWQRKEQSTNHRKQ